MEHGWNVRAAADAIGKRRETVTRLLTATFGGRDASKRAWRIREASGRLPEKDAIDRLYRLFCEAPTGPDVEAAREAWRARGVLP